MLKWLKKLPTTPGLPDPNKEQDKAKQDLCVAANTAILEATGNDPLTPRGEKRKRGSYGKYTPEDRYKMGKYGAIHGASTAAKHFTKEMQKTINESTIH